MTRNAAKADRINRSKTLQRNTKSTNKSSTRGSNPTRLLQQRIGNQAVQRLHEKRDLQADSAEPKNTAVRHNQTYDRLTGMGAESADTDPRPPNASSRAREYTSESASKSDHLKATDSRRSYLLQRLLQQRVIQPKLTVNQPNDEYEKEADRVAKAVIRMPTPRSVGGGIADGVESGRIQRMCSRCQRRFRAGKPLNCTECEETLLQRTSSGDDPAATGAIQQRIQSVRSGGRPLPNPVRSFFEPRMGQDFSNVRIHTDSQADEATRMVGAEAFTVGQDVVFRSGAYRLGTEEGKRLLAHELTHVVQQTGQSSVAPRPIEHAPAILQQSASPQIMRKQVFTSTMEICHRLLESRVFNVSEGGIRVTANAAYERRGTPECSDDDYHMTLNQKGFLWDSEYGTCDFPQGRPVTRQWTSLPADDYTLTIWTNNTNPYCCLVGDIVVDQQSGLQGDSCTEAPPGPVEVLHGALDLAGLIPGLGVVADGTNLLIYAAEGDWVNAGISAAALVPVLGGAAVVVRRGRQVVRVSSETVERMGRDRIASGLQQARKSRRATEATEEAATGARRRIFGQRNPPAADPSLPPGTGSTDKFGNITYSSAGTQTEQALARYHEQVHSFLSPRLKAAREFRADLMMSGYNRSAFLRYLEEALAETYGQLRVHGIRNLPNGIRFPIENGYVTLKAVVTEASIGTVTYGGITYGVYVWVSQESSRETETGAEQSQPSP